MGQYGKENDISITADQFDKQFPSLFNAAQTQPGLIIRAHLFSHFLRAFAGNYSWSGEELLVPIEVPVPVPSPSEIHAQKP